MDEGTVPVPGFDLPACDQQASPPGVHSAAVVADPVPKLTGAPVATPGDVHEHFHFVPRPQPVDGGMHPFVPGDDAFFD